jgi:hypothetical protein
MLSQTSRRSWTVAVAALLVGLTAGLAINFGRGVAVARLDGEARVTDARGREVAIGRDGGLRRGHRVLAGTRSVTVTLLAGGTLGLGPQARLALLGATDARLEAGVAIVDTTTVTREIRIETPAGRVVLTAARVEIRAALATAGGPPALASLEVEAGAVRMESAGRSVTIESGESGLLVAGRPPVVGPAMGVASVPAAPPPPPPIVDEPLLPVAAAGVVVPVPVAVPSEGSIVGVVEVDRAPLADQHAPACAAGGTPAWAVSDGKLSNAYVRITSALPGGAHAPAPARIAQRGCAFQPRVSAVMVGQPVIIEVTDGAAHEARIFQTTQVAFAGPLGADATKPWTRGGRRARGERPSLLRGDWQRRQLRDPARAGRALQPRGVARARR